MQNTWTNGNFVFLALSLPSSSSIFLFHLIIPPFSLFLLLFFLMFRLLSSFPVHIFFSFRFLSTLLLFPIFSSSSFCLLHFRLSSLLFRQVLDQPHHLSFLPLTFFVLSLYLDGRNCAFQGEHWRGKFVSHCFKSRTEIGQ
jgi:hypothetical protein